MRQVLWQKLRSCPSGDHIRNDLGIGKCRSHWLYIFLSNFKRAGAVVIGINQQQAVHTQIHGMAGGFKGFPGIVAAGAGEAKAFPLGSGCNQLRYLMMFFPAQRRAFPGRSHSQNACNPALNLETTNFSMPSTSTTSPLNGVIKAV